MTWHLEQRFSVGIMIALVIQAGSFVWYASKVDSRIENLENARTSQEESFSRIESVRRTENKEILQEVRALRDLVIELRAYFNYSEFDYGDQKKN